MTRFVQQAIARAGLMPLLEARRAGDVDAVRGTVMSWSRADLLVLGAIADAIRDEEVGREVRIHERAEGKDAREGEGGILWASAEGKTELDVLRAVAVARIAGPRGARVGIDWSVHGLELAQVALGFGASDLRGPITRKSGLPIFEDEARKVKGEGMVDLRSLKKREIALLVEHAGREPVFVDDAGRADHRGREEAREVAGA